MVGQPDVYRLHRFAFPSIDGIGIACELRHVPVHRRSFDASVWIVHDRHGIAYGLHGELRGDLSSDFVLHDCPRQRGGIWRRRLHFVEQCRRLYRYDDGDLQCEIQLRLYGPMREMMKRLVFVAAGMEII